MPLQSSHVQFKTQVSEISKLSDEEKKELIEKLKS